MSTSADGHRFTLVHTGQHWTTLFCVSVFFAWWHMQHGALFEVLFATADADSKELLEAM